jgi:catechol 2,3-dioxygenase-like lactoylglutathione lyase family enzyme
MSDIGLTHVAFSISNLEKSVAFYAKYARMTVVHQRVHADVRVAWMTDYTRPFVIVLAQVPAQEDSPLGRSGTLEWDARVGPKSIAYVLKLVPRDVCEADPQTADIRSGTGRISPILTAIILRSLTVRRWASRSGVPGQGRGIDENATR